MKAWVVRAGRKGEGIEEALQSSTLAVGFRIEPELKPEVTCEEVWNLFREERPEVSCGTITKWTNEIWDFRHTMQVGDYIAMPYPHRSGTRGFLAIGRIDGEYKHRAESDRGFMHTRKVEWINKIVPRSGVSSAFESSIRQRKTVSNVSEHIEEILELLEQ